MLTKLHHPKQPRHFEEVASVSGSVFLFYFMFSRFPFFLIIYCCLDILVYLVLDLFTHAEMAAVSCGTRHASTVSTPLRWTDSKMCYKKLFTHVESHASTVSLLESRE